MTTGGAEAPFAAFALIKVGDDGKAGLHHGHEDQLGDALAGLDGEVGLAAIPDRDHELALIVGVDEPNCYTLKKQSYQLNSLNYIHYFCSG